MIFVIGGAGLLGRGVVASLEHYGISFEIISRDNWERFRGRSCSTLINCNGNSKKFLANSNPLLLIFSCQCSLSTKVWSKLSMTVMFTFPLAMFIPRPDQIV